MSAFDPNATPVETYTGKEPIEPIFVPRSILKKRRKGIKVLIWIAVVIFLFLAIRVALALPTTQERLWIDQGASEARLARIEADAAQERLDSAQELKDLGNDWNKERAVLADIEKKLVDFQ